MLRIGGRTNNSLSCEVISLKTLEGFVKAIEDVSTVAFGIAKYKGIEISGVSRVESLDRKLIKFAPNIDFNLTYLGVTRLAKQPSRHPKRRLSAR